MDLILVNTCMEQLAVSRLSWLLAGTVMDPDFPVAGTVMDPDFPVAGTVMDPDFPENEG